MKIPVSKPDISDLEKSYVSKAMGESAISGLYGEYLELFNSEFASFCGTNFSENCFTYCFITGSFAEISTSLMRFFDI